MRARHAKREVDVGLMRTLTSPGVTAGGPSFGLLLLRVGVGAMMALRHGWPKFQSYGERAASFADPFGIGGEISLGLVVFAELVCAGLLVIGLATRAAVIPLIVTMGVAVFLIHWEDPLAKKEMAIIYLAPYLALLFTGPGRFSVDGALRRG